MFANATRKKFRYPYKGQINTEDLWDLTIEQLNQIYITLSKQLSEENTNLGLGFIIPNPICAPASVPECNEIQEKMDIVRRVAEQKAFELSELEREKERNSEKAHIRDILLAKREQELMNKSAEELEDMLKNL